MEGFKVQGDRVITTKSPVHRIYLPPIDGMDGRIEWGRLHLDLEGGKDAILLIRSLSYDEKVSFKSLPALFNRVEPKVNHRDILLYDEKGRYLYLMLEIICSQEVTISGLRVMNPGDNFLQTFPEIYRKRGSAFHRFLSIFSTIYNDFDWDIENIDRFIDIDRIPIELLSVYMEWLGVHIDPHLDESIHRRFLKAAYELNSIKGTSESLKRIVKIITGNESRIIERSYLRGAYSQKDKEAMDRLFGSDDNSVTILIYGKRDPALADSLIFILNQYKPVKVSLSVVYTDESGVLDSYSFLSENARIENHGEGVLDKEDMMGQGMVLK